MARVKADSPPRSIRLIDQSAIDVVLSSAIDRGCPKSLPQVLTSIVHEWHLSRGEVEKARLTSAYKQLAKEESNG